MMKTKLLFISIFAILFISSAFAEELQTGNETPQYQEADPADLITGLALIVLGFILGIVLLSHLGILAGFGIAVTGIVYVVKYLAVKWTPIIISIWAKICSIF